MEVDEKPTSLVFGRDCPHGGGEGHSLEGRMVGAVPKRDLIILKGN